MTSIRCSIVNNMKVDLSARSRVEQRAILASGDKVLRFGFNLVYKMGHCFGRIILLRDILYKVLL